MTCISFRLYLLFFVFSVCCRTYVNQITYLNVIHKLFFYFCVNEPVTQSESKYDNTQGHRTPILFKHVVTALFVCFCVSMVELRLPVFNTTTLDCLKHFQNLSWTFTSLPWPKRFFLRLLFVYIISGVVVGSWPYCDWARELGNKMKPWKPLNRLLWINYVD